MIEKFKKWSKLKENIHFNNKQSFYVKQREIWYINMGINIGTEENGKKDDFRRPVLVLKKNMKFIFMYSNDYKMKR